MQQASPVHGPNARTKACCGRARPRQDIGRETPMRKPREGHDEPYDHVVRRRRFDQGCYLAMLVVGWIGLMALVWAGRTGPLSIGTGFTRKLTDLAYVAENAHLSIPENARLIEGWQYGGIQRGFVVKISPDKVGRVQYQRLFVGRRRSRA